MIGYGTKANQQKVADAAAGKAPEKQGTIGKILHPSEYPVEAAAGSSMVGEAAAGVYGAELIRDHIPADFSKGWAIFLCELLAVYSYGNLLFTKEKKDPAKDKTGNEQSLMFAQSQSKPVGMIGKARAWMKEHPVIVSSIINIVVGITMMCFATGPAYFVGASILLAANVVQALLVKKRDFNVEGALEDRQAVGTLPVGAHTARVAGERQQRDAGEPGCGNGADMSGEEQIPIVDWESLLRQVDADLQILELVTGQLADGSDHYAYVSIPPSKYIAFKQAQANGQYDLADYGLILQHGPGLTPSAAVQKEMEEKYGADHHFEEELARLGATVEK